MGPLTTPIGAEIVAKVGHSRQGDFDRRHHLDHVAQTHRIGEPAHGLLGVTPTLGITGLVLMSFRQQRQLAEAAGLHHRKIEVGRLGISDALALLLHQKPEAQIVKLGHGTGFTGITLAAEC